MGGRSSKQSSTKNPYAGRITGQEKQYSQRQKRLNTMEEGQILVKESQKLPAPYGNVSNDEFYDGIPQYRRSSLSQKSRSLRVSEVSSRLGRAGSVGLERAVEVLDTLGSSMTNLNSNRGFVSGASSTKNNELSILAFEVANTIVKGSNLMHSLSKRSIQKLKDLVLPAESVQRLISTDEDTLLKIVAADKREELKVFLEEVVRFGNRCKDPQWHNLDRFFEKRSSDRNPQKLSREEAEAVMQQLMTSVQLTAELYQEQHELERFEQDYLLRRLEELKHNASQRGDRDHNLTIMAAELKSQKKLVKSFKKKSLWSRRMEDIMGQLVDIVLFLNQEINNTLGNPVVQGRRPENGSHSSQQTLGDAGLALHYANIILQIDSIVARSSSMSPNARDTLYQSLPPNVKASLRSKLQSSKIEKELTVTEIKDEMEKTLSWLVPTATNTAKDHHGFGWVGEWANTGSEQKRRTAAPIDVMKIETLQHADRQKTETYILDLLVWLNYLVSRSKSIPKAIGIAKITPPKESEEQPIDVKNDSVSSPSLCKEDQELILDKTDTGLGDGTPLDVIDRDEIELSLADVDYGGSWS